MLIPAVISRDLPIFNLDSSTGTSLYSGEDCIPNLTRELRPTLAVAVGSRPPSVVQAAEDAFWGAVLGLIRLISFPVCGGLHDRYDRVAT